MARAEDELWLSERERCVLSHGGITSATVPDTVECVTLSGRTESR